MTNWLPRCDVSAASILLLLRISLYVPYAVRVNDQFYCNKFNDASTQHNGLLLIPRPSPPPLASSWRQIAIGDRLVNRSAFIPTLGFARARDFPPVKLNSPPRRGARRAGWVGSTPHTV
ncbi:hypothetical protein [Chamaesiphon minutus]|uniref:hypothetical protein n=1 Tax=Chamaesiphon minutus TaxID=1173032 RepID=UPI0012F91C8C|nr:hypothetical protein [Chamaesiphon minutus]